MTKVSIYDPFADVFPSLLRSMFTAGPEARNGSTAAPAGAPVAAMPVDVVETAEGYQVHADLPGVPKESIQIDIDGNRVTLRAEVKREITSKPEDKVLRTERYVGTYARTFTLAEEIDETRATARFDNGVLELSLPRKAGVGPRRLTVQ